ncbi:cyclic nucleotide-binding domain-containing protein, partial [Fulvivirga sp. RKSG066]|nr:cyclic nucleotide-binding domain-containing protein [Fulvivirga aurantia]
FDSHLEVKAKMLESLTKIYSDYNANLFKAYKSSMGFFNLAQLYKK